MKLLKLQIQTKLSLLFLSKGKSIRHIHRLCLVGALLIFTVGPIYLNLSNPDVSIFASPSAGALHNLNAIAAEYMREVGRVIDFRYLGNHARANYPFIEMLKQSGIDFEGSWRLAYDALQEVSRYGYGNATFVNFIDSYFLDVVGNRGSLRIVQQAAHLPNWIVKPYFFGLYDWRFNDGGSTTVDVRDDNLTFGTLTDGVAYMRVNTFVSKAYEQISRRPYWSFDFDTEKKHITNFFQSLYGYEHLVIDIRSINSGFRNYFLPLIVAPNIEGSYTVPFYAFHTDGEFALSVSEAFRTWHGICTLLPKEELTASWQNTGKLTGLVYGFRDNITVQGSGTSTFTGTIWILADSTNMSGNNQLYLMLAQNAGFRIIYEPNPDCIGWVTSFTRLPYSGLALKYNPLLFTDSQGRSLEMPVFYPDVIITGEVGDFSEVAALILNR